MVIVVSKIKERKLCRLWPVDKFGRTSTISQVGYLIAIVETRNFGYASIEQDGENHLYRINQDPKFI